MDLVPDSSSARGRLVLLAPPQASVPDHFQVVDSNVHRHEQLLSRMQRLRGRIYLEDGAIQKWELTPDGRHEQPADDIAWHLLAVDKSGEVYGCARYVAHENTVSYSELGVSNSPLATSKEWGALFRESVEAEIRMAARRDVSYVEVGGWALAPEMRCSAEAIRLALASYSLARTLGGCLGIGTVTRRHCSSSILRKIGGRALSMGGSILPHYYDPKYQCEMEMLRFDSAEPNVRFEGWIQELSCSLLTTPVVLSEISIPQLHYAWVARNREVRQRWTLGPTLLGAV